LKELTSALGSVIKTRLSSPFLGSFILCWLGVNHKIILTYWSSEPLEKVIIIQKLNFEWTTDLLYPFVLALIYIFAIPSIQWVIDICKYKVIDRRRLKTKKEQDEEKFNFMAEVSSAEFKSQFSYQEKLHTQEFLDWSKVREAQEKKIQSLNSQIESLGVSVGASKIENKEIKDLKEQFKTDVFEAMKARNECLLDDVNSFFDKRDFDNRKYPSLKSDFIVMLEAHILESEKDIVNLNSGKTGVAKLRAMFDGNIAS